MSDQQRILQLLDEQQRITQLGEHAQAVSRGTLVAKASMSV